MSQRWERSPSAQTYAPLYDARALRPYTEELSPPTMEDVRYFAAKYELTPPAVISTIRRGSFSRYALPIYDPRGQERGMVLRQPWSDAPLSGCLGRKPKADTYTSRRGPIQSHYDPVRVSGWPTRSNVLVIVEDQLSAIKLATYGYPSVALLGTPADKIGTYGGTDRVAEISKRGSTADEVIVALDADATEDAFMFARKWGHAFRRLRVAILSADIKDTPSTELTEVLGA